MNKFYRVLLILLSVLTGAVFIYSAYTKVQPIQPFEYTMVEFIHIPWFIAALAARFFVGLEFGLGFLIAFHIYGKGKWVLNFALLTLIIFSIYLIFLWMNVGNNVNCGCFGDAIWMTPSASLIKNGIILIIIYLIKKYNNGWNVSFLHKATLTLLSVAVALPFILYSIPSQEPSWLRKDRYQTDLSFLYATGKPDAPKVDLAKGKHVIAFLSKNCAHCRIAAYKMHLMKQANPALPFYMVIGGESELDDFWKATKAQNIPYTRLDKDNFLNYTGGMFPLIILVNDGWVEAKADYNTLSQPTLEAWLEGKP